MSPSSELCRGKEGINLNKSLRVTKLYDSGLILSYRLPNSPWVVNCSARGARRSGEKRGDRRVNLRFCLATRIFCSRAWPCHRPEPSCSCSPPRNGGPTDDRDDAGACSACCAHRKCSWASARPSVPIALPPSSISLMLSPLFAVGLQQTIDSVNRGRRINWLLGNNYTLVDMRYFLVIT